ncbi:hypothetical protein SAY87_010259 [Trapa incisa]|uniref:Uncharacterized protein n=1 Tax=Trapa incisa TaxID=236973 RepID=A0AAN7JHV4_9MYRT|nr:hypothetical protein SAY87_010259 [Trapa incisa]
MRCPGRRAVRPWPPKEHITCSFKIPKPITSISTVEKQLGPRGKGNRVSAPHIMDFMEMKQGVLDQAEIPSSYWKNRLYLNMMETMHHLHIHTCTKWWKCNYDGDGWLRRIR